MFHTGCKVKYCISNILVIVLLLTGEFIFPEKLKAQSCAQNITKWSTWLLTQTVPSPVFYHDKNESGSKYNFGFRWQITPVNISFGTNKLTNPVSAFKVNPLKRHNGSVEILVEPEWTMENFRYSDLKRFSLGTGMRIYLPLKEYGEYLSSSFAVKYNLQRNNEGNEKNCVGIETGIYSFFGIIGFKFNYNFNCASPYNISLNLKYY